ncbi:MAG: 4-(cytidine 5'-diphospho)-2-C-methyl-D-erythritol kinase [Clostridia bacterium]|nr:4-(cytidine 5'-diphospho)-2-C-methyl-D-erythritol kinase [Clostridia bacterium]
MKKVKLMIPAKVNLTLDVCGRENKFHLINSLVASVDLYDKITVVARKDDVVTLREKGIPAGCSIIDNNAFMAAKLFMQTFHSNGVDIIIDKAIPVSGGLGGSSADIAGVLLGMNKLYATGGALKPLADKLGSDAAYMMTGGFAVIKGRGEIVEKLPVTKTLYMILIPIKEGMSARESYAIYDEMEVPWTDCTSKAIEALLSTEENSLETFASVIKNDLYRATVTKIPVIDDYLDKIRESGALAAEMSGSGSTVYGIYKTAKERDQAYKKLCASFPDDTILKVKTLTL